jgi:hypothetical protein
LWEFHVSKREKAIWSGSESETEEGITADVRSAYQPPGQQYFSIRTNQPLLISQQYFSRRTNQHYPSATSQTKILQIRRKNQGKESDAYKTR